MPFAIPGCRAFAIFWGVLNGILGCSGSSAQPTLYSVVDGHWTTSCVVHTDPIGSYQVALDFSGAREAKRTETFYADTDCVESSEQLQYTGYYELIVTVRDFVYGMDLFYENRSGTKGLPVPLKNLNLVQIDRGHSLEFGSDLADENERPLEVRADLPQLIFLYQPKF